MIIEKELIMSSHMYFRELSLESKIPSIVDFEYLNESHG